MTDAEIDKELAALHALADKRRLYRWLNYVVTNDGRLSLVDIADAKKVLVDFSYLKDKP